LVVESSLMLKYRAPIYFFVNAKNHSLADRIERGLRLAINDGSFDRHFYNSPVNRDIFTLEKMKGRKIFELNNPLLSAKTPLSDESLWFDDKDLAN
jgi:hypothetical protein